MLATAELTFRARVQLNQIPENPTEANDVAATLKKAAKASPLAQVEEKPLPNTPIPTPVPMVGHLVLKDRPHSSPDLADSPPLTPRKTLSKRRTSIGGPPVISTIKAQKAAERTAEPTIKLDPETGSLRQKRIHRRSATVHATKLYIEQEENSLNKTVTTITASAGEVDTTGGSSSTEGGVLSSLRRSLSLGRSSSGRPRSRSRDSKPAPESNDRNGRAREKAPPVPQLPAKVYQKIEQMRKEDPQLPVMVPAVEVAPSASRGTKAAVSERASERPPSRVTGAVMAGIASIKKRKSKPQLHPTSPRSYPPTNLHDQNGQRKVLHTPYLTSPAGVVTEKKEENPPTLSQRRMKHPSIASPPSVHSNGRPGAVKAKLKPTVNSVNVKPLKGAAAAAAPAEPASVSSNPSTPTSPRGKSRKNSSTISNLLSLRPKSRASMHMSLASPGIPAEPVPALPISTLSKPPAQKLAIKEENVGSSVILAGVRELQEKKAQTVPAFKLQGSAVPRTTETRHAKDQSRRLSLLGTSSISKSLSEPAKKASDSPVSPAKGKNSGSFLVKFCKLNTSAKRLRSTFC